MASTLHWTYDVDSLVSTPRTLGPLPLRLVAASILAADATPFEIGRTSSGRLFVFVEEDT